MEQKKLPYIKSYNEFLDEGRENVNKMMDKVLLIFCLLEPALCIGKCLGLFSSNKYQNIAAAFLISVALSLSHHTIIHKNPASKKTSLFVLIAIDLLLILMANAHIGIYMSLFLVPMISIVYYNINIFFTACIINYICTLIIAWTTSDYYSGRDFKYLSDSVSWFFNRMRCITHRKRKV